MNENQLKERLKHISDDDRLSRMESYLDEMISLTDDLIKQPKVINVDNSTEYRK